MSANDNAMTRFLFAILQQKCLKDIDWNKVAHDPILAQEITNGHAARMRYSRFRAAMLGLEPQRRNRTSAKSRVSKSKKEAKGKKEEPSVKLDPAAASTAVKEEPANLSPKVKQETVPVLSEPTLSESTIGHTPSGIPPPDLHTQLHTRLLTPCSDSDILAASQGFSASPGNEMMHAETPFDFSGATHYGHEHMWPRANTYPAFSVGYDLDSYTAGFCEHQHNHQAPDGLAVSGSMLEGTAHHVMVKHEEWDAHQYQ